MITAKRVPNIYNVLNTLGIHNRRGSKEGATKAIALFPKLSDIYIF